MSRPSRHPLVVALFVLVLAECVLVAGVTIYLVVEIVATQPASYASGLALIVLALIATIWLGFIAANILRGRAWVRGGTLVWQVLQIAVAIGCFQGVFAQPQIGWVLLVPALVAIGLLFAPPVIAATSGREPRES